MKSTGVFNNLKAIMLALIIGLGSLTQFSIASDVYDANLIAMQRAGVAAPMATAPMMTPTWYDRAAAMGTAAKERMSQFGSAVVNPETYKAMGRNIQSGASQTWQGIKSAGSTAFSRETYKPLFQAETYRKLGKSAYEGAGAAYQWAKDNPKISIPLGVAIVGGIAIGTYYSTVTYMSPQEKMAAQNYIALQNQLISTVEDLVQFKEIRQALASLNANTSKRTGVTNIREKLDKIINDAEKSFITEFDKALLKSERKTKLTPEYNKIKQEIKNCLNEYILNATGDTTNLNKRVSEITGEIQDKINNEAVVLVTQPAGK